MTTKAVSPVGAKLGEGPLWNPDREIPWWADIKTPALLMGAPGGAGMDDSAPFSRR